ncbi:MAG TPA: hypothetical protein GXZ24_02320 [Firmicutes bacterium]|nr:hypothetical protein [Bacillota bacterium]
MEKIINLAKQHEGATISRAMNRSLAFGAFGYGILKRIIVSPSKIQYCRENGACRQLVNLLSTQATISAMGLPSSW